jgi:hypothetical protein
MKNWKQWLAALGLVGAFITWAALRTLQESDQSAELSFFNSLAQKLNRNPDFLSQATLTSAEGWQELDERVSGQLIRSMLEKRAVDCGRRLRWRLNRQISRKNVTHMLRIQVLVQEERLHRVRVVAPGSDRRFSTSDDEVYESSQADGNMP